jgi:predicted RNase H-like HicB family nuclease
MPLMADSPAQPLGPGVREFGIQLHFAREEDGRFHVYSPSVPGLHLHGSDLAAVRAEIEPIIKDLVYFNLKLIIDQIRWVPSLDEMVHRIAKPKGKSKAPAESSEFLVLVGRAA